MNAVSNIVECNTRHCNTGESDVMSDTVDCNVTL